MKEETKNRKGEVGKKDLKKTSLSLGKLNKNLKTMKKKIAEKKKERIR